MIFHKPEPREKSQSNGKLNYMYFYVVRPAKEGDEGDGSVPFSLGKSFF